MREVVRNNIKCNKFLEISSCFSYWPTDVIEQFNKDYMIKIDHFLDDELRENKVIYPKKNEIFEAFKLTAFDNIKVVIIGQDPYHGPGQAHGLSFSVKDGVKVPPSLKNIYKELTDDCSIAVDTNNGNLKSWAKQGVLLLNNVLTVEEKKPASHKNCGWEIFTDFIIDLINKRRENIVFLLWGKHALLKGKFIDRKKHFVLESSHPSPFSAYRGFLGSKHFSRANQYLKEHNLQIIDWGKK